MQQTPFNAIVVSNQEVAPGVFILRVAPEGWTLPPFKPGQFAVLGLPVEAPRHPLADPDDDPRPDRSGLLRRSYSIASSSRQKRYVEFFFSVVRSGDLSPRLGALRPGDRLWLSPKFSGFFTLDQVPAEANVIMVATGTGLAPYMSMLRSFLPEQPGRRFGVIHGARHSWDLGYRGELEALQRRHANLLYLPVISAPTEEVPPWGGLVGRVQDVWRQRPFDAPWGVRPAPPHTHVLLCGNPAMVESMSALLQEEGFREHSRLAPGEIHVERYW
jgi:ferredoxin--NADP+ reductase